MKISTKARESLADARYSSIAKKFGAENSLRAFWEARKVGISPSLAMAILEQESGGGKNVWGHDPTIFIGGFDRHNNKRWGPKVTKDAYLEYKKQRGHSRMQGVGPMQLTWWEFQDEADRLGGAWKPRHNIAVGFRLLSNLVHAHGERKGLAVYNGGLSNPNYHYADQVLARKAKWHKRLAN